MGEMSGGCHCGAVRYRTSAEAAFSLKCHCTDCRKVSGAGHGAYVGFPGNAVTIEGKATSYVRKADSGNEVTRYFCPACGTSVYSRLQMLPDLTFFYASTLDDVGAFAPQMSVYASRAPAWDRVNEDVPSFAVTPPPTA